METNNQLRDQSGRILVEIQRLKSLRREISLLDHNLTTSSSQTIREIVENSESILENISYKLDEISLEEDEWSLIEESKIIEKEFVSDVGVRLSEEMLRFLSEEQERSYPSQSNEGLMVSLHNAGNILKRIKQEKADRAKKSQSSGPSTARQNSNKTLEAAGETTDADTSKERYIDLALMGFCVVLILSILAIFSPEKIKKKAERRAW